MKRPNQRIIGIEMAINVQEAYRKTNKWDQKRKSSCHIIIKTLNAHKKKEY